MGEVSCAAAGTATVRGRVAKREKKNGIQSFTSCLETVALVAVAGLGLLASTLPNCRPRMGAMVAWATPGLNHRNTAIVCPARMVRSDAELDSVCRRGPCNAAAPSALADVRRGPLSGIRTPAIQTAMAAADDTLTTPVKLLTIGNSGELAGRGTSAGVSAVRPPSRASARSPGQPHRALQRG